MEEKLEAQHPILEAPVYARDMFIGEGGESRVGENRAQPEPQGQGNSEMISLIRMEIWWSPIRNSICQNLRLAFSLGSKK